MAGKEKKKFLMRIDPGLWTELEQLAASEFRSINAQIEFILREAVKKRKGNVTPRKSMQPRAIKARR